MSPDGPLQTMLNVTNELTVCKQCVECTRQFFTPNVALELTFTHRVVKASEAYVVCFSG